MHCISKYCSRKNYSWAKVRVKRKAYLKTHRQYFSGTFLHWQEPLEPVGTFRSPDNPVYVLLSICASIHIVFYLLLQEKAAIKPSTVLSVTVDFYDAK